jgi:glutamate racemase
MIVVACGTVSCVASDRIENLDEPSTGVTKPASKSAVEATKNNIIGVIGTSATINSGAFDSEIKKLNPNAKIISTACPLFVPLVENNWIAEDDEVTTAVAKRYLKDIMSSGADTIILGCTHFPILAPIIQKVVGDKVTLIDTGLEEAKYVEKVLKEKEIQNDISHKGEQQFFVSDKTAGFCDVAEILLGENIEKKCSFVDIFRVIDND